MPSRQAALVALFLLAPGAIREAGAQHFGKNKVEYVDFDFKILETEHFAVYHYSSEEDAARIAGRLAERWYARLSRVLEHELPDRQPLVLYGSHPEFAQTNVINGFLGEGIGGVTESARRRIVMPFAPTLAETDRILGHELTHAFQMDIARRYGGGLGWPLWVVEGLAQYLSLGARNGETAMWLRDASIHDLLPDRQSQAAARFSPYRYGHAMWAYLAGRFGDRVIPRILKAKTAGALGRRITSATGLELDALYADFRAAAKEHYAAYRGRVATVNPAPLQSTPSVRLSLGPSLSPDGRKVVFFSERDRLSLDLFLADAQTGAIVRKLATTAASARFESLQAIRSAGAWSPEGDRFVFGAIDRGKPALILLDMDQADGRREIRFPQFGEILSPSWSPDGRSIAFTALEGGVTDLYVYDLHDSSLRQITDDPYADLHAAWSPDGARLAFVTDRFTSDLQALRFGATELAVADARTGAIERLPAIEGAGHFNPQWSPDGRRLYFVSDAGGISNVHRLDVASGRVAELTDEQGGVEGLTPTSPALSVARSADAFAFTRFRKGRYEVAIEREIDALDGRTTASASAADDMTALPPVARAESVVADTLADDSSGLPESDAFETHRYASGLSLEAIGPPYISTGGGPFGTYFRAGGSVLFSDFLGERRLAVFAQAGNRLNDLALLAQYVNRERRWNWGATAEVLPTLRRLPRMIGGTVDNVPVSTRETHFFERIQFRAAGLLAYPLDRAQRVELEGGVRHMAYRRSVSSVVRSAANGRVLSRTLEDRSGGEPATAAETSAAYVRDTAVYGPTSPILGARTRFEVTSTFGELASTRVLLDHRQYVMPVRPYTIAARALHLGQYGADADDSRLLPTFLGSRALVRGYGWNSISCGGIVEGECAGYNVLLGSRLLVGNVELRAPLLGLGARDLRYGPVPAELFVFGDAGLVWSRAPEFSALAGARHLVRSFGIGVRLNAFGLPFEWSAVRATDRPSVGWSFGMSFAPAF
jgi:hypothetical protein